MLGKVSTTEPLKDFLYVLKMHVTFWYGEMIPKVKKINISIITQLPWCVCGEYVWNLLLQIPSVVSIALVMVLKKCPPKTYSGRAWSPRQQCSEVRPREVVGSGRHWPHQWTDPWCWVHSWMGFGGWSPAEEADPWPVQSPLPSTLVLPSCPKVSSLLLPGLSAMLFLPWSQVTVDQNL